MFPKNLARPPTFDFLSKIQARVQRPELSYLITGITATTLGHAESWLPAVYDHATASFPAPMDASEKLRVFRHLKEALLKSAILIGVPKAIEASLVLTQAGAKHAIHDHSFFRKPLLDASVRDLLDKGDEGLKRVYRDDIKGIFNFFGDHAHDLQFISRAVTYGIFLGAVQPNSPLTAQETQVVILSALIAQRANREILWHLRGSLRNGFGRGEVEVIQRAIESACAECGHSDPADGLPRVADVEKQAHE